MSGSPSHGAALRGLPEHHRVAHYEISGELGRGGMGIVYRARDLSLERDVALKTPWPELAADRESRHRFLREARAASSLSHPNIVPVFEVFEADGLPWIAMELVEGANLRASLRDGAPLPLEEILRYAEGLAEALQFAHGKHILHRDVNPKNILVTQDGRARLTDFGLAKIFVPPGEESSASTQSSGFSGMGAVIGTPGYMSPEQALGKKVDPRSDIFALGIVLYEMATGRPAFAGNERGAILDALLHREPPPIARLNYEVPAELERIIRKCLAKRAEERYQEARELLADLRALRRRVDSGISLEEPSRPPTPRLRTRSVAMIAGAAILGVAALLGALETWRRETPVRAGESRRVTTGLGWESHPTLSPDGSLVAFDSDESGDSEIWLADTHGGNPLRLTDDPANDRSPAWLPDGSAVVFVSDRTGADSIWKVSRLGGPASLLLPDAQDPSISPDGTRIAFSRTGARGEKRIAVAPLHAPANASVITGDDDGVWDHVHPAWSPDGRSIAYGDARNVWIVPSTGGKARRLTAEIDGGIDPDWSSDGRFVFFSSYRQGTLAVWRAPAEGGAAERVTLGTGPESQPSVSKDGSRLAYTTFLRNSNIVLRDLASGQDTKLPGLWVDYEPAVAPDGRSLVFVSNRWGRWDLWWEKLDGPAPSGEPRRLTDEPGSVVHPVFSPDGRWIAYHRVLGERRNIRLVSSSGGHSTALLNDGSLDLEPAWSPDGGRIAFASNRDGAQHIWVLPVGEGRATGAPRRLTSGETSDYVPAWSPDGKTIAYIGGIRGEDDVWTLPADGSSTPRRLTQGATAHRVRWDPAGARLLVSGLWGGNHVVLRTVMADGGEPVAADPPVVFGGDSSFGVFDVSRDHRLLVYSQEALSGDIWVMEAGPGSY